MKTNKKQGKLLRKVEKWDNKVGQNSQFVVLCREFYNMWGFMTKNQLIGLERLKKAFKLG